MRVAIYLRLSSEDGDLKDTGKAESESISNQRGLLQNFISGCSEFRGWEISEFCDDGWSGKNFERPDFLRMMEQVKQGQIHCTDKMERLEKSTQSTTEHGGAFIEKYKEYTELETLTGEIARDVVKRVTVHKDGGIEIELALRDELEELLNCLEAVDAAS